MINIQGRKHVKIFANRTCKCFAIKILQLKNLDKKYVALLFLATYTCYVEQGITNVELFVNPL